MFVNYFWHRSRNKRLPLLPPTQSKKICYSSSWSWNSKRTEQLYNAYSKSASVVCNRFLFWIRRHLHSSALQYFKSISEPLLYSAVLIWKVSLHCSAAHTVIDRSCKPLERLQETNIPVVRMRVRTMMMAIVMITMMWYCFFLQMMIISYIWASRKTAEEEHSCGGDEDGNSDDDNGNDDDDLILLFFRWWSYHTHTHEATL